MDSQAPSVITGGSSNSLGFTAAPLHTDELAKHDTASSTGSANRLSEGYWALNLSGNCSSCHHHHNSVQVRVRVSGDSTEVGDVRCDKCKKLWLAFGKGNSRRLSLLSTKSLDRESLEAETEFHSTLVNIIKATNPIAALHPTLTAIPEVASVSPSRETSVRSTARSHIQRHSAAVGSESKPDSSGFSGAVRAQSLSKKYTNIGKLVVSKGRKSFLRLKRKVAANFRTSQVSTDKLLLPSEDHPTRGDHSQVQVPTIALSPAQADLTDAHLDHDAEFSEGYPDVCTSSTTAAGALAALKAVDRQAIQALPPCERFDWGRRQLTEFKARYTGSTTLASLPVMSDVGTQANASEDLLLLRPLVRRHSALAYVGNIFGTNEYWDTFRGSTHTLDSRPFSMSETNLSDADTAVERMTMAPTPHQLFIESLQRDRRGSGSSRPLSMHSIMNDWQQTRRNRGEARLSIDSAATGNAVRNITTTRGRASNRLSRSSMNRTSSVYGTEPQTPRAQFH